MHLCTGAQELKIEDLELRIGGICQGGFYSQFSMLNPKLAPFPLNPEPWTLDCLLPRWTLDVGRRFYRPPSEPPLRPLRYLFLSQNL